ncbi:MAG: hypothetical protein QXO37_07750 [Candidatus Nitrosocaldaceae archaeon]
MKFIKYGIISAIVIIAIISPYLYNIVLLSLHAEPNYNEQTSMKIKGYDIKRAIGSASMPYQIKVVKDQVIYTIRGEVVDIREPLIWLEKYPVAENGMIPVDIKVKEVYKGDIKSDSIITLYVGTIKDLPTEQQLADGVIVDNSTYILPYEAVYEIGEDVLVHVMHTTIDLVSVSEYIDELLAKEYLEHKVYETALGKYGKYTIKDGLAYNENYPYGVPIIYVAYEAL